MNLKIINLTEEDYPSWDAYVQNHERGTLFHLIGWKNAIEKSFNTRASYFCAKADQKLCGIIPLFKIKTLFSGCKIISIPYSVYGGVLGDSEEIEQELIKFCKNYYEEQKADYLELRYLYDRNIDFPKQNLYVTYKKRLANNAEEILNDIPKKSRASVRKGLNNFGLKCKINNDIHTFLKLYSINKRKLGSPQYPEKFISLLMTEYKSNAKIGTVFFNDIPVVSAQFFYFRNTIMPYFSGSDHKYWHTNANNVLYYELMKHARELDLEYFDFGRSRKGTGPAKFKEYMGFKATPLHYYFYSRRHENIPNITPSNKKFNLVSQVWSHLPLIFTKSVGPLIVKRIP